MRGNSNFNNALVQGNVLPSNLVNNAENILTSADDDATYELFELEPPIMAGLSTVNVAFSPLREGKFVLEDAGARQVTVEPMRVIRSSSDNSLPRAVISATVNEATVVACGTIPAAGDWGFDLLYAELTYVDASDAVKGTQVNFFWAQPVYAAFAAAGPFGTLPTNTSTAWYVPIAYVRVYAGQTAIAAKDIIEIPPDVDSGFVRELQLRINAGKSSSDIRRGYSSANNSPETLTNGGTSAWISGSPPPGDQTILLKTSTPIVVGRRNVECVRREFVFPAAVSGYGMSGTGGVQTMVIDDTRDWRGANFKVEMFHPDLTNVQFGEDDPSLPYTRIFPVMADTGAAFTACYYYAVVGNSWVATNPGIASAGSQFWAAFFGANADVKGIGPINGQPDFISVGEACGMYVDSTTGVLTWWTNRSATAGPPAWILVEAWFSNHQS